MYGQINNKFNVSALTTNHLSALDELIEYTTGTLIPKKSTMALPTASALKSRVDNNPNLYGFCLHHSRRGLIAYREYFYTGGNSITGTFYFEKRNCQGLIRNRLDYWVKDVFPEVDRLLLLYPKGASVSQTKEVLNHRYTTYVGRSGDGVDYPIPTFYEQAENNEGNMVDIDLLLAKILL